MTLLNFNMNQSLVSCEVNLKHGHNVVVRIEPIGGTLVDGSGPCPIVECVQDISNVCPSNLVAQISMGNIYRTKFNYKITLLNIFLLEVNIDKFIIGLVLLLLIFSILAKFLEN